MKRLLTRLTIPTLGLLLLVPSVARAQDDDPKVLDLAQPDFTLVGLPTSLRLPKFGSAFRVTHRFLEPLNQGDFGDLAGRFFGLDTGAQIGLEYRFGIVPNGQIGVHRTSDRTIEFFGQYDLLRQGASLPFDVSVLATAEGTNNFKGSGSRSPSLGAIVSRTVTNRAAFYVEPIFVDNSNPLPAALVDHNNTFMVGLGARVRIRPTVYVVGEAAPRAGAMSVRAPRSGAR